jgi:protoporphyrinogen oxidase
MGVQIHLNTRVEAIQPIEGSQLVITSAGQESPPTTQTYDQVLSTTSPGLMAKLAPDLPTSYLEGLLSLKSMGAVVMVFSLKHQLSEQGYYWYNIPKNAGFPFLSLVEHTNYLSPEHFGGDHIIYVGDYLPQDHEHFDLTKEQIMDRFLPHFNRFNPSFKQDWVKKTWLFRTKYAQPVPLVNHSRNIPAIQTPIPGLYFASMSQVYPWDRGTNFAVEIGRRAARLMLAPKND